MKKRRCSLRFATNEPPALRTPGKETPPMKEKRTETGTESRPAWESLEALARQGVQRLLQQLLEDEVEEVLGRRRYERRNGVNAPPGYGNGWGKPRRLSAMAGTVTVRRPRVRGLEARFESRLLPLFKRRTEAIGRLLPELYLHGLAQGDFDLALRGRLGAAAPLSATSIARLKASWHAEYQSWKHRRLVQLAREQQPMIGGHRGSSELDAELRIERQANRARCRVTHWGVPSASARSPREPRAIMSSSVSLSTR